MARKTKWHLIPPPPPSPKILHFPRRRPARRKHTIHNPLHQQNEVVGRRERVEEVEREDCNAGGFAEEKWRFQAEILRAECNLLRMEREFALKKLEKKRLKIETTLKSALHTLLSGREEICKGKNVNAVLEEEIDDLADKLEELQKTSIIKLGKKCSNFDKQATVLQRQLEKISHDNCTKDIEQMKSRDVERAEEEYNSMVSNSSVASPASSSKRIEFCCFNSTTQYQEAMAVPHENKCSGRCKAIVRKIVEQVRAETEQWSQMQEMLARVRGEMEELQASRDYWQNRALKSDCESQSLKHAVEEWKEKALDYQIKANQLQLQVEKMQKARVDLPLVKEIRLGLKKSNLEKLKPNEDLAQPISLGKQLAKERRMLFRHLKENRLSEDKACSKPELGSKRSSLRDIGNMSSLSNRRAGVDFYSLEKEREF